MDDLTTRLKALSSANEFLDFFGIPYDEQIVNVNRLHILKRFYQYLHKADGLAALDEVGLFTRYRELLAKAYQDFTQSNAATEKVFKVFQDAGGQQHVSVNKLRDSLAERRESGGSAQAPAAGLRAA
jgi:nitrogenase-stabilizing/protective protein